MNIHVSLQRANRKLRHVLETVGLIGKTFETSMNTELSHVGALAGGGGGVGSGGNVGSSFNVQRMLRKSPRRRRPVSPGAYPLSSIYVII